MSLFKENSQFNEAVREIYRDFDSPSLTQSFAGGEIGNTLEHVTRRHFIDRFLESLGWDVSRLNADVMEEAQTQGLRLDYLGLNQQSRAPALIVEAKPWGASYVGPSAKKVKERGPGQPREPDVRLVCQAIEHCKAEGTFEDSPVTREWAKNLAKLRQYVASVKSQSGHVVKRVAMLSGQWLVVFCDPEAVFLTPGPVNSLLVSIYQGKDEFIARSDEILNQLSREAITKSFPEMLRPSILASYISGASIRRSFRALWVSRHTSGPSFQPRPNLHFAVAIILELEREDRALLTVVDPSLGGGYVPHDYTLLGAHIRDVSGQSEKLVARIENELGAKLEPSGIETFPGFMQQQTSSEVESLTSRTQAIKRVGHGEFLLIIGSAKHFFLEFPTVNPCGYHEWTSSQLDGHAQGQRPIVSRSVEPRAFFITGEGHHCAHIVVHDRRNPRCLIDAFEEYLCCRACAFQRFCWRAEDLAALPCGAPK